MFTTAKVEATVWNLGAWRPSGGAGPVLQRDQLLGARPAEFMDHTSKKNKTHNKEQFMKGLSLVNTEHGAEGGADLVRLFGRRRNYAII